MASNNVIIALVGLGTLSLRCSLNYFSCNLATVFHCMNTLVYVIRFEKKKRTIWFFSSSVNSAQPLYFFQRLTVIFIAQLCKELILLEDKSC